MKMKLLMFGILVLVAVGICAVVLFNRGSDNDFGRKADELIIFTYEEPAWLTGHPLEERVNGYIAKEYSAVFVDAGHLLEEFPDTALLPFQLRFDLERSEFNGYESVLLTEYAYTGGAHGNTNYRSYTLRDGEPVTLIDYLNSRRFEERHLLALLNKYLEEDAYETIETLEGLVWTVHPPREENQIGIRVIFPPYAVASYAAGTISYTL